MASFNTAVYDITPETYNMSLATYIDGSNCIAMSGTKWYNGAFGELMCSFAVDGGDSILGGNVIISGDATCCSKLLVKGVTTFNANPVCSVVPTSAYQLVNKTYVDTAVSGSSGSNANNLNNRNITNELLGFNNFVFINISTNSVRT